MGRGRSRSASPAATVKNGSRTARVERAEDVVMPAGREGEAGHGGIDHLPGAVRAKQPVGQEELAALRLRFPDRPHAAPAALLALPEPLQYQEGAVEGAVRVALIGAAVPAAVLHLPGEEVLRQAFDPGIIEPEVGAEGEDQPW